MENIKVALRIRPLNETEKQNKEENIFEIHDNQQSINIKNKYIKDLINTKRINISTKLQYKYNICYDQQATNYDIFKKSVQ